ncbi:Type I restriction-modification system, DNA methylase subunit [Halobacillus karajensis]|uniref:Eco57I restriction-modification methylase domain-containing protein n=1 Tax=Halobacillus karajensis TaxID=195088 RepID=UPI0008A781F5|nr:N-6 DNA methylase [Halobacillus karajensis]SEI13427.1 Type I restriction-modification system, DNA methylase subunit [Halobacillus karajensis]
MSYSLQDLIRNFRKNEGHYISKREKYNEHSTRVDYIDPLLKLLGWDLENQNGLKPYQREVIPENYIKSGDRPDYTMTLGGVKKFFIEAKKPSVDIKKDKKPALQARRYGYSAKHYITVLTNFRYIMIYDTTIVPKEEDDPRVALLAEFHYEEFDDRWEEISSIISRSTVFSGEFDNKYQILFEGREKKSVDEYFVEQINNWRLKLAAYLHKVDETKYSVNQINDIVQKFLNQMIFLRMCEDRNLPLYHKLKETIEDVDLMKEMLEEILIEADKKYNSGIFDDDNELIVDLSNEIILEIIEGLYYPQSPFIFNVIETNILGEIYELFLSEKIVIKNKELKLEKVERSNEQKAEKRDIVSTPQEIVKFMVGKNLSNLLYNKSLEQVLEMNFADIACGSGIFLVEIYNYLIEHVKEIYIQNDWTSELIEGENEYYLLPFELKEKILLSCIYGIDIDSNAVEVSRFNLLLKLLEDENEPSLKGKDHLLPDLEGNITHGNSLIDFNNIEVENLSREEYHAISPFNWEWMETETFDLIIGNPPYVQTKDMRAFSPKKEFNVYNKLYKSSYKQFDKYYIFVERSLSLLKENGIVSYIIPNKFSKTNSGTKLRELLKEYDIKEFIDFGSTQIFKDKNVITYSSILTVCKNKPSQGSSFYFEEVKDIQNWWKGQHEDQSTLKRMKLDQNLLSEEPWVLVASSEEWDLLNALYKDSMLLGDSNNFKTVNGVQTSAESKSTYSISKKEIINSDEEYLYIVKNKKEYKIERDILKVFFKPRRNKENKFGSYDSVEPFMWIIFPYDINGKIYTKEKMQNSFWHTWKYLCDNYDYLLPKQFSENGKGRDVPHATKETWYHYGRSQAFKLFNNTPKLIIGVNTHKDNPLNILDKKDMVIASGGTAGYCAITLEEESPYELEYVHAVLNHPAIVWLCSVMGSDFEGDFYSRGTYVLNRLPIKKIDFNDKTQLESYNKVVNLTKDIENINSEFEAYMRSKERKELERLKSAMIKEIEGYITKIYGIEDLMHNIKD